MLTELLDPGISRNDTRPLHKQIMQVIIDKIKGGHYYPGARLGTASQLATDFQVHRNTALRAIDYLVMEGWLETKKRIGIYVAKRLPMDKEATVHAHPSLKAMESLTRHFWQPDLEETLQGQNLEAIHEHQFELAYRKMAAHRGDPESEGYGYDYDRMLQGLSYLLESHVGMHYPIEQLCYIKGHGMAYYGLARLLGHPGEGFAIETPGNFNVWKAVEQVGLELLPVPLSESGLDLNVLERMCKKRPLKAVYVNPRCQFPTTQTLSGAAGEALVALSERYGFYIIEGDYMHEFWYPQHAYLPLAARYRDANIIYIAPVSTTLDYMSFIGVVAGPQKIMREFKTWWDNVSRQSIRIFEKTVENLLFNRNLVKALPYALAINRQKRDAFAESLDFHHAGGLYFQSPQAGFAFWLRIHQQVDMKRLHERLLSQNVLVASPDMYAFDKKPVHGIRVGFAGLEKHEIGRVTSTICQVTKGLLDEV